MIKLEGTVLNVFTQQGGKDKKTGDQFADRDKVQILGAMDQKISIAVGAMASGRNVIFYVAKGAKPVLAEII